MCLIEAALHVFEGIDIAAVTPKMKITLARRGYHPRKQSQNYSLMPMSLDAGSKFFLCFLFCLSLHCCLIVCMRCLTADVMGIVVHAFPARDVYMEGTMRHGRDYVIVDHSKRPILLTLWKDFESIKGCVIDEAMPTMPIIIAMRVRVLTENYISLSTQPSSIILVAPDGLEARELDCWCERNVSELVHMIFDNKSYADPAILLPPVRAPTLIAISSVASFTRFSFFSNDFVFSCWLFPFACVGYGLDFFIHDDTGYVSVVTLGAEAEKIIGLSAFQLYQTVDDGFFGLYKQVHRHLEQKNLLCYIKHSSDVIRSTAIAKFTVVTCYLYIPSSGDDTVIGNGEDDDGAGPCGGKFKKLLIFSGNDYLGLSSHPTVIKAAVKAAQLHGMGPRGSALICSYTNNHRLLESALADLKKKEDCLLCPAGFAANMALITAVGSVGLVLAEGGKPKRDERVAIFSDALNHASNIDGIRLAEKQGSLVNIERLYWSLYWRLRLTITFLASMLLVSANSKCSSEIQMSPWSSTRKNTCIPTPVPYIPCCFNFRNQRHGNHVSMASYISPLIY
ncbi:unnamed protein product [Coffea canephora]|uniref:Uncharacterized protein n=1 Tax=Coffea canephora TaxID=49390 RepID=A0A068UFE9_COFCA|nr:unnamed protein product [Coffea canephora]